MSAGALQRLGADGAAVLLLPPPLLRWLPPVRGVPPSVPMPWCGDVVSRGAA